ncbi:MAG: site-specific integrase [Ginsengibacter sp.]
MKQNDFSKCLTDFLIKYLPGERGMSGNTIASYKMTFILLIAFMQDQKAIQAHKLVLKHFTKACIEQFLNHLETDRKCCASTRNARLAALHSFFNYVQCEYPEYIDECSKILSIKVKKTKRKSINYLTIEGMQLLFEQPDLSTRKGVRDLALLALMYDTGARVQEIIDTTPSSLRLDKPYTIKLIGKGTKARIVPLMEEQIVHLKYYIDKNNLLDNGKNLHPLFYNHRREKLTRAGVNYILQWYAAMAKKKNTTLIPDKISPHSLRHSKAMHLLQAGVNLVYIRDILGHESVTTTELYARVDSKQKREAIEKAFVNVVKKESPMWMNNEGLLQWLKSF